MKITNMTNRSAGIVSFIKALSLCVIAGMLSVFALSFEAQAADDGVPFDQELKNIAINIKPRDCCVIQIY